MRTLHDIMTIADDAERTRQMQAFTTQASENELRELFLFS